jgi:hypothetical protein
MHTQKTLERFESVAQEWMRALNIYSDQNFLQKQDENSWSIGQVYNHLVNGTNRFHLQMIAACLEGRGKEMKGGKKFPGKFVFFTGSFPNTKIKVPPSETYTPKQPAGREAIREGLQQLIQTMRTTADKVSGAPVTMKAEHPAFGYLNAHEWFDLIEMHFRHHLRQKKRLDQFLGINKL